MNERGTTHGKFSDNARYGQTLRTLWRSSRHWDYMTDIQREALDMAACKLSRILSGRADYVDHYIDLVGYFQLVVDEMEGRGR